MWPRGRDSSEAAFQTAPLGQVSSLQNSVTERETAQNTAMKKLCQWKPICTKAYLHKPAEAPGWCLTLQDWTLHHFMSKLTCNKLRGCAMDTQNPCLSASSMLLSCSTHWRSVAVCTWRGQLLSWSLIPMQNGDVSAQLSYGASLSPGSSLNKHLKQTPGAMKRSWPGATPVALEPWHLWRKVSGPALWDLVCKWCHLSYGTPCLLHSCSNSHLSSSSFLCKTVEQIQAGRCREVPAGRALYMGNWENQRERTLAHSLGRSMHRDFSVNLGKAGKIRCKPNSSHFGVCWTILGFKVRMKAGQLELSPEVC